MEKNTIRIECNPYTKRVKYYWKNDSGENAWSDLAEIPTSPFSKSKPEYKNFSEATLAHKAYEILEQLDKQYNKGNNGLDIVIDGTTEDYEELKDVLESSFSESRMECYQGDSYILTAKETMPQIERIYSSLEKLLSSYDDDEISELIAKYTETVRPEISICVMGLYSSGKSSFINSLIGKEILPSASDPATAKIYKISCEDSVWLDFEFDKVKYHIDFYEHGWKINVSPDAELVNSILGAISNISGQESMVYEALKVLNEFAIAEGKERKDILEKEAEKEGKELDVYLGEHSIEELIKNNVIKEYRLADMISIAIPFCENTLLPIKSFKFVIFDTPGSNSEMHKEHVEILKKALADRTNGLPIFVTNADTLDYKDNAPVIELIEKMGTALDRTSTMIVVNKADEKSKSSLIQKREKTSELKVTSWKSSRIYFVSSIISLGMKKDNPIEQESWRDQEYADVFYNNYKKFDGTDARSLLELFKYNILPSNVENALLSIANSREGEERILWNSGIRSIEHEISTFGERFALYNKCAQAEEYLEKAISRLEEKLSSASANIDSKQKEIEEKIEGEVKTLEDSLSKKCNELKNGLDDDFLETVTKPVVSDYLDNDRIEGNITIAINSSEIHMSEWKKAGWKKSKRNLTERTRYIKRLVSEKFDDDIKQYAKDMNDRSEKFWDKGISDIKDELLEIVYNKTDYLTEEQKDIAKEVVMKSGVMNNTHDSLDLSGTGVEVKKMLWITWEEFNKTSAQTAYKTSLRIILEQKNNSITLDNTEEFNEWKTNLIDTLRVRLSDLNPDIIELNKQLNRSKEERTELREQLKQVNQAQQKIVELLSFKEAKE